VTGQLYLAGEYLRPWKVASLSFALAVLVIGSYLTPAPDWDVPITFIMGLSTYLAAPPTVRVFFERRWRLLPITALVTWLSVDGFYALYWHFRDPNVLSLMRSANAPVSLVLYLLCGIACAYRGSLKELAADVRSAIAGATPGDPPA
jgi:hypothetical protein